MKYLVSVLLILGLTIFGCSKGIGDSDGTTSQVVTSAISGASAASEGSVAYASSAQREPAVPSCDWSNLITACVGTGVETLSFDGCSIPLAPSIRIQGSESLSWTGSGCCTPTPLSASSTTPCSYTRRTVNAIGTADPMIESVGTNAIKLNTEDTAGFETPKTGGFEVTCQGTGGVNTCDAQRQIVIHGAHYTGEVGPMIWDQTVSTDQPLVVQGHGGGRTVLSGTVRVQHNLKKQTAVTTITSPLTFTAGCCVPTGGSISTNFVGGAWDGQSEKLTYGPKCGEAQLTDSQLHQSGLTLHHCL